jgi:hypothetical protein
MRPLDPGATAGRRNTAPARRGNQLLDFLIRIDVAASRAANLQVVSGRTDDYFCFMAMGAFHLYK